MLVIPGLTNKDTCDGITRRELLRVGGSAMFGISLAHLLGWQKATASDGTGGGPGFGKAKSVILIYLQGGPSHLDLWDPKDNVPDNVRSVFKAIPTRTPGGAVIAHRGEVRTVQEGITRASTGAVAFLLCQEAANYHLHPEIAAVPVTGMPPSRLGLVWPRGRATEGTRRFARTLASVVLPADAGPAETDYPC